MVAILENGEFNSDFHPMVDFIAAFPLRYALTVKPAIFVSYIRQFWSTARIETTNEGTYILATMDGIQRTVSESSLRRNLKLRDEDGIVSIPDTELFENLTLMGLQRQYSELLAKFQAQEEEIIKLKERVKVLEDKEDVAATQSRDDAPIKGRSINEGEAAAERISNDSEEIARVLTSINAATVLAGGIDVPTGSGSIPTVGPPATVISIVKLVPLLVQLLQEEMAKKLWWRENHALVADGKTPTEFALMANTESFWRRFDEMCVSSFQCASVVEFIISSDNNKVKAFKEVMKSAVSDLRKGIEKQLFGKLN
nr:hypothetical protein [Tanacetum cinerariifolium]